MATRAVIMCPPDWLARCLEYCRRRRYEIVAVITNMAAWDDVLAILRSKRADVVVLSSHEHVDPTRTPRLESLTDEIPRLGGSAESPGGDGASH